MFLPWQTQRSRPWIGMPEYPPPPQTPCHLCRANSCISYSFSERWSIGLYYPPTLSAKSLMKRIKSPPHHASPATNSIFPPPSVSSPCKPQNPYAITSSRAKTPASVSTKKQTHTTKSTTSSPSHTINRPSSHWRTDSPQKVVRGNGSWRARFERV